MPTGGGVKAYPNTARNNIGKSVSSYNGTGSWSYSAPGGKEILWSLRRGQPTSATFRELCAAVAPVEFELHIRLNLGNSRAVIYASDLTEDYVDFNKGDVGDPSSLGG